MSHYSRLYKIDHGLFSPDSLAPDPAKLISDEKKSNNPITKLNPFSKKKLKPPPPPIKLQPISPSEVGFLPTSAFSPISPNFATTSNLDVRPKTSVPLHLKSASLDVKRDFLPISHQYGGSLGNIRDFNNTMISPIVKKKTHHPKISELSIDLELDMESVLKSFVPPKTAGLSSNQSQALQNQLLMSKNQKTEKIKSQSSSQGQAFMSVHEVDTKFQSTVQGKAKNISENEKSQSRFHSHTTSNGQPFVSMNQRFLTPRFDVESISQSQQISMLGNQTFEKSQSSQGQTPIMTENYKSTKSQSHLAVPEEDYLAIISRPRIGYQTTSQGHTLLENQIDKSLRARSRSISKGQSKSLLVDQNMTTSQSNSQEQSFMSVDPIIRSRSRSKSTSHTQIYLSENNQGMIPSSRKLPKSWALPPPPSSIPLPPTGHISSIPPPPSIPPPSSLSLPPTGPLPSLPPLSLSLPSTGPLPSLPPPLSSFILPSIGPLPSPSKLSLSLSGPPSLSPSPSKLSLLSNEPLPTLSPTPSKGSLSSTVSLRSLSPTPSKSSLSSTVSLRSLSPTPSSFPLSPVGPLPSLPFSVPERRTDDPLKSSNQKYFVPPNSTSARRPRTTDIILQEYPGEEFQQLNSEISQKVTPRKSQQSPIERSKVKTPKVVVSVSHESNKQADIADILTQRIQDKSRLQKSRGVKLGRQMTIAVKSDSQTDTSNTNDYYEVTRESMSKKREHGHVPALSISSSTSSSSLSSDMSSSVELTRSREVSRKGLTMRMRSQKTQIRQKKYAGFNSLEDNIKKISIRTSHEDCLSLPSLSTDVPSFEKYTNSNIDEEDLLDQIDVFLEIYLENAIEEAKRSLREESKKQVKLNSHSYSSYDSDRSSIFEQVNVLSREENIRLRKQNLIQKISVIRSLSKRNYHQKSSQEKEWDHTLHILEAELVDLGSERVQNFQDPEMLMNIISKPVHPLNVQKCKIPITYKSAIDQEHINVPENNLKSLYPEDMENSMKNDHSKFINQSRKIHRESNPYMAFNPPIFGL